MVSELNKPPAKADADQLSAPTLPTVGRGKWSKIAPFVGICRETARKLAIEGKFPRPIHMSPTCALYDFAECHKWIAGPTSYRAE